MNEELPVAATAPAPTSHSRRIAMAGGAALLAVGLGLAVANVVDADSAQPTVVRAVTTNAQETLQRSERVRGFGSNVFGTAATGSGAGCTRDGQSAEPAPASPAPASPAPASPAPATPETQSPDPANA